MIRLVHNTLRFVACLVLGAAVVCIVRTIRLQSGQPGPGRPALVSIDTPMAAARLAALVRLPTISRGDPSRRDAKAFDEVLPLLRSSFPVVHRQLTAELIARWSLLYTWRGSRADLPPIILCAHLDVVPVDPDTSAQWTHPPFDGAVAEDSIWGRGAIDDKSGLAGLLEATEALLESGFTPVRTVYLAMSHNEEGGGDGSGAAAIAAALAARGVRQASLLNEGGLITDQLRGVHQAVAFVGIAEKGQLNLELVARSAGGHSAMPPAESAVGLLARALDRIEHNPMPARLQGASARMFETLAPDMSVGLRLAFANLWLTRPVVVRLLGGTPQTNALIRTTTAPTMLEGSPKANVLALIAKAIVNVRLLPGDTAVDVESHLRRVIADDRIELRRAGPVVEASRASPSDTPDFDALARSIRAIYPTVLVAPYLTVAGTDSGEYESVASHTYRFLPIFQDGALESIHGVNEHVTIAAYRRAIEIYATLIEALAG